MDWTDFILKLCALCAVYTFYFVLKPLIDSWIKKNDLGTAARIVGDAVEAAQQTIKNNSEKKEYVVKLVNDELEKLNIDVSVEMIDALIESAVHMMKADNYPFTE